MPRAERVLECLEPGTLTHGTLLPNRSATMDNDDKTIGRLLTRRELVALFGSSAVAAMAHRVSGQVATPPAATAIPACVVQPQQTEGPYFVDEKLLRSDIRADPSTGVLKAGAPLALALKVSQVMPDGTCGPLAGAQVDLWQCDAMGVYSDVKDRSFDTVGAEVSARASDDQCGRRRAIPDHLSRLVHRSRRAPALQGPNGSGRGQGLRVHVTVLLRRVVDGPRARARAVCRARRATDSQRA